MEEFDEYVSTIKDAAHRMRTEEVLDWVGQTFPRLGTRIAWNQPMFTDHGTFIISFSAYKHHLSVAPEQAAIEHAEKDIVEAGYEYTHEIIRIPWSEPVDYGLLQKLIQFNIEDKAGFTKFWRKPTNSKRNIGEARAGAASLPVRSDRS